MQSRISLQGNLILLLIMNRLMKFYYIFKVNFPTPGTLIYYINHVKKFKLDIFVRKFV